MSKEDAKLLFEAQLPSIQIAQLMSKPQPTILKLFDNEQLETDIVTFMRTNDRYSKLTDNQRKHRAKELIHDLECEKTARQVATDEINDPTGSFDEELFDQLIKAEYKDLGCATGDDTERRETRRNIYTEWKLREQANTIISTNSRANNVEARNELARANKMIAEANEMKQKRQSIKYIMQTLKAMFTTASNVWDEFKTIPESISKQLPKDTFLYGAGVGLVGTILIMFYKWINAHHPSYSNKSYSPRSHHRHTKTYSPRSHHRYTKSYPSRSYRRSHHRHSKSYSSKSHRKDRVVYVKSKSKSKSKVKSKSNIKSKSSRVYRSDI